MLKTRQLFIALLLFTVVFAQTDNAEFRATWVITWEHMATSQAVGEARVIEILGNHKAANMNAVLWQARQSGTAYYNSNYEPWGYYAGYDDPGYDPLAFAIEEAHKRGIEVHAWFNVFHCSSTQTGTPAAEHPEWVCRDGNGNPMTSSRALSPGMAEVREYTLDVAMDMVNSYDIDGIHLDYIRWNEYDTGDMATLRGESEIEQISKLDGVDFPEDFEISATRSADPNRFLYDVDHPYSGGVPAGHDSWEDFWRSSVTTFVQMLHDSIQAVKPWVRLSVAALGKYNWSGWQGYGSVYQDAALWFNEGYIEQLTPMHYHWLDANSFYGMLVAYSPECWGDYIQPGVAAGRLFSAGPGSYRFDDEGVWYRHPSVINRARDVAWLDGFQFFSYGSWKDYQYWDEAGHTFFGTKTKIRPWIIVTPPTAPTVAISKTDDLNYDLTITPGALTDSTWNIVYRSEDADIDTAADEIIAIKFGSAEFTITESFSGSQDFDGTYYYAATSANRYWNESLVSNIVNGDPLPSLPPAVTAVFPVAAETAKVNTNIIFNFSKTIDTGTFLTGLTIEPEIADYGITWSTDWEDYHKKVTINPTFNLAFDTTYTFTLDASVTDLNGVSIDGNGDGTAGDSYVLTFMTEAVDLTGPVVSYSNLEADGSTTNLDIDEVITFVFDEEVDETSVSTSNVELLLGGGSAMDYIFNLATIKGNSVLSLRPATGLVPDTSYTINLTGAVTDTLGNTMISESYSFATEALAYEKVTKIDNFALWGYWKEPGYSGTTVGILAGTEFVQSSQVFVPGTSPYKSAKLSYVWDTSVETHLLREYLFDGAPRNVTFDTSYVLQCYVFGDGSLNKFRFAVDDNLPATAAEYHEVSPWYVIDWIGWKLVSWDLGIGEAGSWLGDGVLQGTMRIDSFQMTHDAENGSPSGAIYFDEFRLIRKTEDLGVDDGTDLATIPDEYQLYQNYPNPFNPTTTIAFGLPQAGKIQLQIFDLRGRLIRTLAADYFAAGNHRLQWNGRNEYGNEVASGIYLYRLVAGPVVKQNRMVFLK